MKPSLSRYWAFQLVGWGMFALINIAVSLALNLMTVKVLFRLIFFVETGILFTHLMRETILKIGLLMRRLQQQIIIFILLTVLFGLLWASVQTPYEIICNLRTGASRERPFAMLFLLNFFMILTLFLIWNLIYFMYHFIMKIRKQEMDTIKLEAFVKDLELKTIKAHINPHFIFNALNGIRSLVDLDPPRARKAITELSNILRSSLSAQKGETIAFRDELKIVKDYLALEHMRFEDRLQIDYNVAEATLGQPVPPMMLQTLVENAIKHGISKQVAGGMVQVSSDNRDNYHELIVRNSGVLNGGSSGGGFGLASTRDRLQLLYGERARFEIKQVGPAIVEARVLLPLN